MHLNPPVNVRRFEQVSPGSLFHLAVDDLSTFAVKTLPFEAGDQSEMLILGPHFPQGTNESCLMKWLPTTIVDYEQDYTVLLPTSPLAWDYSGERRRNAVTLAIVEDEIFVCTNGGKSPTQFRQFYVNLKTGKIVSRICDIAAFTTDWEITVPGPDGSPRSIIRYPLTSG